jgi:hypothetical protein
VSIAKRFGMYSRYLSSCILLNMSLKIYLLRHGETEYSQRGAYCGALDAELTAEGHLMAQAFAEAYRRIPWTDVYVSPMALGKIENRKTFGSTTKRITCAGKPIRPGIHRPMAKLPFKSLAAHSRSSLKSSPNLKAVTCWWYPIRPQYASSSVACWEST